jgi:hypothetical protein
MKFSELLAELRTNILHDTSALQSGPSDHYWSDDTLVRYINDAQRRFARQSLCIRDFTTPEVVEVVLKEGVADYVLHPSVRYVISAKFDTRWLIRTTQPRANSTANPATDFFDVSDIRQPGEPQWFATDVGFDVDTADHPVTLTVYPTPSATETDKLIRLRTCRLPLTKFSLDDGSEDKECEIPEERQLDMLEWAAWLAFRNWDIDSEDRQKGEMHKKRFEEAIEETKREVRREVFQPLTWQFGTNGFTWS